MSQSPGLARSAYPGNSMILSINPNGVVSSSILTGYRAPSFGAWSDG